MMADDASGNNADLAVPRHMARDAPDDGAFDATLGLGDGGSQRQAQNGSSKDQRLHGGPPRKQVLRQSGARRLVPWRDLTPRHWHGLPKPLITALIRCGENSLAMYCFGVLLAFLGFVNFARFSSSFAMQAAVSFAGIALMIAAATLLTWEAKLDRHGPKLF
jgi:hypothetical protein